MNWHQCGLRDDVERQEDLVFYDTLDVPNVSSITPGYGMGSLGKQKP